MILVRKTANTLSVVDTILIRGFKFEELVTMLSAKGTIHKLTILYLSWFRC